MYRIRYTSLMRQPQVPNEHSVDAELPEPSSILRQVMASAARLQRLVPDAVLVGGTAVAYHARHRDSLDHDHVLADLDDRFDLVLDALEREPDWVLNRATPGKILLGDLGGIEAGVRQLIRRRPLDVETADLGNGVTVTVPTIDETLRIKAFLVVRRNQTRDYLDVAALSDRIGSARAARILTRIDDYYGDLRGDVSDPAVQSRVASQVVRQLGNPRPKDTRSIARLPTLQGIRPPLDNWDAVRSRCIDIAAHMLSYEND